MYTVVKPLWWKYGRPADFWLKNIRLVKEAIEKYKLEPVLKESLMEEEFSAPRGFSFIAELIADKQEKVPSIPPKPFPGGIRIPHFHFEKDVYLLSEEQWKDFSTIVIKDFQAKLARVNTVNFEQVMEMSEAMDSLV